MLDTRVPLGGSRSSLTGLENSPLAGIAINADPGAGAVLSVGVAT